VNFTVRGLPVNSNRYDFEVVDIGFSYRTLSNETTPSAKDLHYLRTGLFTAGELKASMIMLDLAATKEMPFVLTDVTAGTKLYSDDLIGMIKQAYQNAGRTPDFATTHEFDIVLTFRANMGVTVSVNGWTYVDNNKNL
jgi:hypothetical protein